MSDSKTGIVVNSRIMRTSRTGAGRYANDLVSQLGDKINRVEPKVELIGVKGHLWEQVILPMKIGNKLLWSPSNAGPLSVRHQVVTIHDLVPLVHPEWLNPRFAAWYQWLLPKLCRRVQRVIAISNYTKEIIMETMAISADKIDVVHNGIDNSFRPQSLEDIANMRKQLGLPTAHYVLSLGALEPRKNLHRLLQAWEIVQADLPSDIWLIIAGSKGSSQVFGNLSLEQLPPRVHLTGYVKDKYLPTLLGGAIAFAYPSVYEGFGFPPLESMACGVPPITGDRTSLPEVVGDAGLQVDPFDVDAIADAIRRLVEDSGLRESLRQKGLERAKQFSLEKCARETISVLEKTANQYK